MAQESAATLNLSGHTNVLFANIGNERIFQAACKKNRTPYGAQSAFEEISSLIRKIHHDRRKTPYSREVSAKAARSPFQSNKEIDRHLKKSA